MGIRAYKKASLFIDKSIPGHKEIKFLTIYTISMINYIYRHGLGCVQTMDFDLSK